MLKLIDVGFAHPGGPPVFRGLHAEFSARGEIVAVLGPSGIGKTTLAALIGGLLRPVTGQVLVDGHEAVTARDRFAWVFQSNALLGHRSAVDNLVLPLLLAGHSRDGAMSRAWELLAEVGLDARGGHRVRTLSGGERQRLALARAFAQQRPYLILDEPTAQLDRANARDMLARVVAARDLQRFTLIVSHDPAVWVCSDRVLSLTSEGLHDVEVGCA